MATDSKALISKKFNENLTLFKSQILSSDPAQTEESAVAGRHFRLIQDIDTKKGTHHAQTYAQQALLCQITRINTYAKESLEIQRQTQRRMGRSLLMPPSFQPLQPIINGNPEIEKTISSTLRILNLTITPIKTAEPDPESALPPHPSDLLGDLLEAAQPLPEDYQQVQRLFSEKDEDQILTVAESIEDELERGNIKRGLIQTALEREIARTMAYIELFFGELPFEAPLIDTDAINSLSQTFRLIMGVDLQPGFEDSKKSSDASDDLSARDLLIEEIILPLYLDIEKKKKYPLVNSEFIKEIKDQILSNLSPKDAEQPTALFPQNYMKLDTTSGETHFDLNKAQIEYQKKNHTLDDQALISFEYILSAAEECIGDTENTSVIMTILKGKIEKDLEYALNIWGLKMNAGVREYQIAKDAFVQLINPKTNTLEMLCPAPAVPKKTFSLFSFSAPSSTYTPEKHTFLTSSNTANEINTILGDHLKKYIRTYSANGQFNLIACTQKIREIYSQYSDALSKKVKEPSAEYKDIHARVIAQDPGQKIIDVLTALAKVSTESDVLVNKLQSLKQRPVLISS